MKRLLAGLFCLLLVPGCDDDKKEEKSPGNHKKEFRGLDQWMERFIAKYDLPGGAIAVTSHGRLVHAQGFGFASKDTNERFKPDTLARVGSFSKLVTASSILKLVEQGKIVVSDPVFGARGQLSSFAIPPGADPQVRDITVRNFLTMTSGWNPREAGDTTSPPTSLEVVAETGTRLPATRKVTSEAMLGLELDTRPGIEYSYLNASPVFLSEIVAKRTGMAYERFVTQELFRPVGLYSPRIGTTREADRRLGEATYIQCPPAPSLYPGDGIVPLSYAFGLLDLHLIGPTGGWLFSAVDAVQFFSHIEGARSPELITPALRANFNTRPAGVKTWLDTSIFYGFHTENFENGEFWGKYGAMPAVTAWIGHFSDEFSVAVILNGREDDAGEVYNPPFAGSTYDQELRNGIRDELKKIKGDLEGDLFETEYQPGRPTFTGPAIAVGKTGSAFEHQVTGLPANVQFSMADAIPGLSINSGSGSISGIPTKPGRYLAEVTISNARGSETGTLDVRIGTPGSPVRRGTNSCPEKNQFVLRHGRVVDEVVMQGSELVVDPRSKIGVQVLLEDADGDLVIAELEGAGQLTIRLESNTLVNNSKLDTRVAKGNPELLLSGTDSTSILRFYALGSLNSDSPASGNGVASGRRVLIERGEAGSLVLGNSELLADVGIAGIDAAGVRVGSLTLGEIDASGIAVPTLQFAKVADVYFLGSRLRQENGRAIEIAGITEVTPFFGANANGNVEDPTRPDATFEERGVDVTDRLFP